MIPATEKELAEGSLSRYCQARVPVHLRDKLRLTYFWRGSIATLVEERPYFQDHTRWTSHPVAQFRYYEPKNRWGLYCSDQNGRWHLYQAAEPTLAIQTLLDEVSRDPTGIFWG
ncbi:MAG: DUF3024 domain-containing protein [Elusimicrobia bacterium]|nr:DUF3024 domain-containing protein [Elusimicrobiota bacterium]